MIDCSTYGGKLMLDSGLVDSFPDSTALDISKALLWIDLSTCKVAREVDDQPAFRRRCTTWIVSAAADGDG